MKAKVLSKPGKAKFPQKMGIFHWVLLPLRFAMAPVANPKTFCLDIKKTNEVLASAGIASAGICGDDGGMLPGAKADGLQEGHHHPGLCVTCLSVEIGDQ